MKTNRIKHLAFGIAISLVITACGGSSTQQNDAPNIAPPVASKLVDQIVAAKANLADHKLPIRIVSYAPDSPLSDDEQVSELQAELVAENSLVPQFDGVNASSFSMNTIGERMQAFHDGGKGSQNVAANLKAMVFPLIKNGQKVLDITWETQLGAQFQTKCIYDDNGIVYDNMLSNLILVKDDNVGKNQKSNLALPATSYTKSKHPVNISLLWIWGSQRGHIDVWHYAQISNGQIVSQWGNQQGWLTLGTATGAYQDMDQAWNYAKSAWGYAWAGPTMSVNISWNNATAKFDISIGGIGSSGSGQGNDVIYP